MDAFDSMPNDEVEVPWVPEFRSGWPDIWPLGLIIARTHVTKRASSLEDDDDDDLRWITSAADRMASPRFAFIGDRIVQN